MAAGSSSGGMSSYQRVALVAAFAAACAVLHVDRTAAADSPEPGTASAELRGFLESQGSPAFASDARGAELWKVVRSFYAKRDYEPAWFRRERLTPGAQALL